MAVNVQCRTDICVPQIAGHGTNIYPLCDLQAGIGMAEAMYGQPRWQLVLDNEFSKIVGKGVREHGYGNITLAEKQIIGRPDLSGERPLIFLDSSFITGYLLQQGF